jgi:micrococcal nuclease
MSRRLTKILLIAALSCISLVMGLTGKQGGEERSSAPSTVEVVRVIDGDSVRVSVNGRRDEVRLIGIDAPEMGQRPWGRRAKEHLEDLLFGSSENPSIEYDVERRDKYGRLLAYVRTGDGRFVNEEMLRDGFAVLFTVPPNVRYMKEFRAAQESARDRGLGIWGKRGLREPPYDYRREHPRRQLRRIAFQHVMRCS